MNNEQRRQAFDRLLTDLLGTTDEEETRVYFQPPSTLGMVYPCIVYKRNSIDTQRANDSLYRSMTEYMVTVIDPNPDSGILNKILELPMSRFIRHYTADNLNHDVFNVYY